jgi:hypothetical protein
MKPPLFSISLLMALATCENPEYQTVWYRYASRKCLQRQEAHIVRPIAGIPGCVYLAWADFPKTLCHSRPAQCGSAYQQYDTREFGEVLVGGGVLPQKNAVSSQRS